MDDNTSIAGVLPLRGPAVSMKHLWPPSRLGTGSRPPGFLTRLTRPGRLFLLPMQFPTTRWDELAKASLHGDTEARSALAGFCQRYWQPVNAFIRWKGHSEVDAADLTQDFFLNFLESRSWRRADRLRGSFRSFLLGALTHRLQKAQARQQRIKRGGGVAALSLDELSTNGAEGDAGAQIPPADAAHFDRAWALRVLEAALAATRSEYDSRGRGALYQALKSYLALRHERGTYEQAAQQLGLHPAAVKTEVHRLRCAFRTALRIEIGRTVSAPHEIDEELRHLRAVLARHDHLGSLTLKPAATLGEE
jgi:DNA-directed RNA polymerase specialized sigma24 family protein